MPHHNVPIFHASESWVTSSSIITWPSVLNFWFFPFAFSFTLFLGTSTYLPVNCNRTLFIFHFSL
eukprot:UN00358